MAGVFRIGFRCISKQQPTFCGQDFIPLMTQKCHISSRTLRGGVKLEKPKPYPYETKKYGVIQAIFDKTSKRIDENSKLIVVEGPIASGKSKFAKELAEELEMRYMPQANMDMHYINRYGYDMRKLDPQLPETCRSFDEKNFCENPKHRLVARMQMMMYMARFSQYIDALAHILSTGEGVVLERCPYSDFVFVEAMYNQGYISRGARSFYYDLKGNTIGELLKPHLVIYLDVPSSVVKERIKERNLDYEVKSKVFSDEYLKDIEKHYKQNYLKDISVHSELLIYDWSNGGETEIVVEDIERIDFDKYNSEPSDCKKLANWRFPLEWDWCEARIKYCEKAGIMAFFNVSRFDVPELIIDAEDSRIWNNVWTNAPGMKFSYGYNEDMGDSGLITKNRADVRPHLNG